MHCIVTLGFEQPVVARTRIPGRPWVTATTIATIIATTIATMIATVTVMVGVTLGRILKCIAVGLEGGVDVVPADEADVVVAVAAPAHSRPLG